MSRSSTALVVTLALGACAPKYPGPTGPEKAAAYHAEQERREKQPTAAAAEVDRSLQFPMCPDSDKEVHPFPPETNGAAFRAIVQYRISDDGKTKDHCYLAVAGDRKWEEKSLGNVAEWSYPVAFAGQPRERVVTYRLRPAQPPAE